MHRGKAVSIAGCMLAGALAVRAIARSARKQRSAGRAVLVTGGSRGLGLAIAIELVRRRARVAICGRDAESLRRATAILREKGGHVLALQADVRERDRAQSAVREAHAHFGRLDALINNAGTIAVGPLETMTIEDYEDGMNTHFWAMYFTVDAALPIFAQQGGGSVVNVTSIGARVSVPHLSAYCASKFAAAGYSEGLRAELASKNVAVTTVFPGLMRTGSPRNAWFKSQNAKEYAWFTLSDSLPGLSISASSAARAIVDAMERGDAEVVLSLPAKAAVLLHGIAPKLVTGALSVAALLLPKSGGIGTGRARGAESESAITESLLTTLGKKAERDYNQVF